MNTGLSSREAKYNVTVGKEEYVRFSRLANFYSVVIGSAFFFMPVVRNQNFGVRLVISGLNSYLAHDLVHEYAEAVWRERVYRAWQMTIVDNELHDRIFI